MKTQTYAERADEVRHSPAPRRHRRRVMPLWKLVICDVLLTGLVLCIFAAFQHVIPRMKARNAPSVKPVAVVTPVPSDTPTPPPTEKPEAPDEPNDGQTEAPTEPETPIEPAELTWREKFADRFTDEVVVTDHSYSSPNISVDISTNIMQSDYGQITYYVADIYIAQIENFQTYLATGEFGYYFSQTPRNIDLDSGAIVAINGDYCNNQYFGLLVRNGQVYMTEQTQCDICVLYYDGTMETYHPDEYSAEDILANAPYQTWKFGPALLDHDGQPITDYPNTDMEIRWNNPRSGLGYYEPGHYCFVIVDGRQSHSRGLEIEGFAQLFADLGCVRAYNMDGGASAVMTYNDQIYSRPSSQRDLGDILLIKEIEVPEGDK